MHCSDNTNFHLILTLHGSKFELSAFGAAASPAEAQTPCQTHFMTQRKHKPFRAALNIDV